MVLHSLNPLFLTLTGVFLLLGHHSFRQKWDRLLGNWVQIINVYHSALTVLHYVPVTSIHS